MLLEFVMIEKAFSKILSQDKQNQLLLNQMCDHITFPKLFPEL